jgi:hypothetical protein
MNYTMVPQTFTVKRVQSVVVFCFPSLRVMMADGECDHPGAAIRQSVHHHGSVPPMPTVWAIERGQAGADAWRPGWPSKRVCEP